MKRSRGLRSRRSTNPPTTAQLARFDTIRDIGCVVAYALGLGHTPCEVHHLTTGSRHGQRRLGHDHTVGLNLWSHRGEPFGGLSARRCRALFGPSYAEEPEAFRALYPDDQLLQLQNRLLELHHQRTAWHS